jgi:NADPH-dependent 2,4-dienoyl-CoA reductase/sulfur reductase-like enzyme
VSQRAVVVGASLAGLRAAEALRHGGHNGPLTVVGEEPHQPYDRPPLSKQLLAGKVAPCDLALNGASELDAEWCLGSTATGLDLHARSIQLDSGETLPFDQLVIATGARPRLLKGLEPGLPGVHYLRTLEHSLALREALQAARDVRLVVVGAGFIGLEVAATASELGAKVTVLEALGAPLERAVGAEMGMAIADMHRRRGVDFRLNANVAGMQGSSVILASGETIAADVVVVGIGVIPATEWLERSGLDIDDGVVCDDRLRALSSGRPVPGVVAAGDVARWRHPRYGRTVRVEHWTNALEQGQAAAHTLLAGEMAPPYEPTPYVWSDQHGLKIQFVGEYLPGDEVMVIDGSPEEERFVAVYGRKGRLVAALGVRRPARVMALQQMIAAGAAFPVPGV